MVGELNFGRLGFNDDEDEDEEDESSPFLFFFFFFFPLLLSLLRGVDLLFVGGSPPMRIFADYLYAFLVQMDCGL
jgi:hypothetical protein